MKKLYLIEYENAHWCGGESHVVVWAHSEDDAQEEASLHMEEAMRELYSTEYEEQAAEYGEEESPYDEESAYIVNAVDEFGPEHSHWEYYQDPGQAEFYPVVGTKDD